MANINDRGLELKGRGPSSSFVRSIAAAINSRPRKSSLGFIQDTYNPLWNIDSHKMRMVYDLARRGNFAQLQYLYNEIENCDPTFMVCVTRRTSALSELDWKVVRSDERITRNADESLIKEQTEFLETAIAKIDNLPDALEHMALSAFRGFSALNIWREPDRMPSHLECLDHWNIAYNRKTGAWLWNPDGSSFVDPETNDKKFTWLSPADNIIITRKRQIDWPAMQIFLRNAIGERDWGRFLETYGLPPVIITMPEFTSKEDEDAYKAASESIFEGRSGVIPYGSEVDFASESRGTNPFTEFIEHQMKLFVLLATGGTLTSLSESGSGTLAGNAQMEVWKQILRADIRIVSNAINKQLCEGLLKECKDFKGRPILAEFQLDMTPKMTADEIAELAGRFSSAGYEMDVEELSKASGFKLTKKQEDGGMGGFGGGMDLPTPKEDGQGSAQDSDGNEGFSEEAQNIPEFDQKGKLDENAPIASNTSVETTEATSAGNAPKTPLEAVSTPREANVPSEKQTQNSPVLARNTEAEDLAYSLQDDFKAVAERINEILTLPEAERSAAAVKLIQELDSMIPDDPMMAQVIAEQMQSAFASQIEKQPKGDAPAANKVVPNSVTVNMSAEKAISYIEWMLGSQDRKDRDEALAELENYKDMIIARVGRKQYDDMVMRASNRKGGNE